MTKDHFICSICHKASSRKFNAERHNENIHSSQGHIIPLGENRYRGLGRQPTNKKFGFVPSSNRQTKEDVLNDALERLGKEFEDCEHVLESLSPQDKAVSLAQLVVHSLRQEDPKQTMRAQLRTLRRHKLKEKIILYVAAGFEISPHDAKLMLINMLR